MMKVSGDQLQDQHLPMGMRPQLLRGRLREEKVVSTRASLSIFIMGFNAHCQLSPAMGRGCHLASALWRSPLSPPMPFREAMRTRFKSTYFLPRGAVMDFQARIVS